ncbi:unnamed protein product, partial [Mesorhabditis spiculigera]
MAPQVENLAGEDTAVSSPVDFDHIRLRVGNAKQAAFWFCASLGFEPFAYKGLETGSKELTAHAVKIGRIILVLEGTTVPDNKNFGDYLTKHGDSVKDVAFEVDNLEVFLEHARAKKTRIVREMTVESDENGTVKSASILAFGDVIHTLIERKNYRGLFLPGFRKHHWDGQCFENMPKTNVNTIDHFVGAQKEDEMESVVEWYEDNLLFHRYWTDGPEYITTENSALSAKFEASENEKIQIVVAKGNEALGKGTNQIQEFVNYNGGPGVQHVALNTDDLVATVEALRARGVELLDVPAKYYELVREKLSTSNCPIEADIDRLQELGIFIDFDEKGYILQKFTRPLDDRPTLFFEFIERHNFKGFGAGNFKAIFEAIERQQITRNTFF